jgi:hypothetical protein
MIFKPADCVLQTVLKCHPWRIPQQILGLVDARPQSGFRVPFATVPVNATGLVIGQSIDKAKDLLGYAPRMTFEDGLQDTIRWFEDHWEEINRDAEFPPGMSSAVRHHVLQQKEQA